MLAKVAPIIGVACNGDDTDLMNVANRFREASQELGLERAMESESGTLLRQVAYLLVRPGVISYVKQLRSTKIAPDRIGETVGDMLADYFWDVYDQASRGVLEKMKYTEDYLRKVLFPRAFGIGWCL